MMLASRSGFFLEKSMKFFRFFKFKISLIESKRFESARPAKGAAMRLIDWNLLKKVSTLKRGVLFNWLLMIYSIFCTTKVSPKRDHQVLKIKLEL